METAKMVSIWKSVLQPVHSPLCSEFRYEEIHLQLDKACKLAKQSASRNAFPLLFSADEFSGDIIFQIFEVFALRTRDYADKTSNLQSVRTFQRWISLTCKMIVLFRGLCVESSANQNLLQEKQIIPAVYNILDVVLRNVHGQQCLPLVSRPVFTASSSQQRCQCEHALQTDVPTSAALLSADDDTKEVEHRDEVDAAEETELATLTRARRELERDCHVCARTCLQFLCNFLATNTSTQQYLWKYGFPDWFTHFVSFDPVSSSSASSASISEHVEMGREIYDLLCTSIYNCVCFDDESKKRLHLFLDTPVGLHLLHVMLRGDGRISALAAAADQLPVVAPSIEFLITALLHQRSDFLSRLWPELTSSRDTEAHVLTALQLVTSPESDPHQQQLLSQGAVSVCENASFLLWSVCQRSEANEVKSGTSNIIVDDWQNTQFSFEFIANVLSFPFAEQQLFHTACANAGLPQLLVKLLKRMDEAYPSVSPLSPSSSSPSKGIYAFKSSILRLLANLCHASSSSLPPSSSLPSSSPQRLIRLLLGQLGAVQLVMNHCVIDDRNPLMREWSVLCLRNLLEECPENEEIVREMQLQTVSTATNEELQSMGLVAVRDPITGKIRIKKAGQEQQSSPTTSS